jgi:hypothetical protein
MDGSTTADHHALRDGADAIADIACILHSEEKADGTGVVWTTGRAFMGGRGPAGAEPPPANEVTARS